MVKIEAIIRPSKLTPLKNAFTELGIHGMTVYEAGGFGRQRGHQEIFRGAEYMVDLVPKLSISVVTTEEMQDKILDCIRDICSTGEVGDGKIFISEIKDVIRIRTWEKGESAL